MTAHALIAGGELRPSLGLANMGLRGTMTTLAADAASGDRIAHRLKAARQAVTCRMTLLAVAVHMVAFRLQRIPRAGVMRSGPGLMLGLMA